MEKYQNAAVHCPTLEIAEKVENKLIELYPIRTTNGDRIADHYDKYGSETCLRVGSRVYCSRAWYLERGYTVISAEEFLKDENKFIDNYSIC